MNYSIAEIIKIVKSSKSLLVDQDVIISNIVYDTRKISSPTDSIFIALQGLRDGHSFTHDAYNRGIRNFIISKDVSLPDDCNVVIVYDCLIALQAIAEWHRNKNAVQTVAITGSNGKTIIKEWLFSILNGEYKIVKSPKSYNSQIGVPLSVLQLSEAYDLAIIEAGISQTDEMTRLQKIIRPDIGILSNIGDAHSAGFKSLSHKLNEKLALFKESVVIIFCRDDVLINQNVKELYPHKELFTWGHSDDANVKILDQYQTEEYTYIKIFYKSEIYTFTLPFKDGASIENIMHVIATAIFLGLDLSLVNKKISTLKIVPLRFEIEQGRNNSTIINDSYSIDLASLKLALEFLHSQSGNRKKALVISDFEQQSDQEQIIVAASNLINEKNINTLITVGTWINDIQNRIKPSTLHKHFKSTSALLNEIRNIDLSNTNILIKGARSFHLEKIFNKLAHQVHQTTLEINLNNISHNINAYRSRLKPTTQIMAVIKASAYGSGSAKLAQYISDKGIDYLAVALADEGVELRKAGINKPILVFNLQDYGYDLLWEYNLEPEVFSLKQLSNIIAESNRRKSNISIHLKLDTGMRRLGLLENHIDKLIRRINKASFINIASIFSHLSVSENPKFDLFSQDQFLQFDKMYDLICSNLNIKPLKHILNSSGILRFPKHQYDLVRLGLGMYGINESADKSIELHRAHRLKTQILQIKTLKKNEATGYGRHAVADHQRKIAVIGIGYADGLMRLSGNGNYQVSINGQEATIVGNVCMDVCMIDITKFDNISEGDEVIIFGESLEIEKLAKANMTISYEILSRISKRVKRIYYED